MWTRIIPSTDNFYAVYLIDMNGIKAGVYKKVLKEIWDRFNGAEEYINESERDMFSGKIISW